MPDSTNDWPVTDLITHADFVLTGDPSLYDDLYRGIAIDLLAALKAALTDEEAAIRHAHLADQNTHYTNNPRHDDATPDWDDLNPEEQLTLDENRYLLENGGIAFGDDETEND